MVNIAIFASGNGSNAQRLIEYFKDHSKIRIALILSNKADAYVLKRSEAAGLPSFVLSGMELREVKPVVNLLTLHQIDFIVLAGFLLMIPADLVRMFSGKIVNIHPALLPKYGGKGMYGMFVHEAVIRNNESESGITIHYVNEHYDEGAIIFQEKCAVVPGETPESLAEKVHALEHKNFPKVVESIITRPFPSK